MSNLEGYRCIINNSHSKTEFRGILNDFELNADLFPFQAACVDFALRAGRSALFLDTGLGKTICALSWADQIVKHTNKPVLMLSPLGVVGQHAKEASRFNIDAVVSRSGYSGNPRIVLANYEQLRHFDLSMFDGVVLDESSILKGFSGATTKLLISSFAHIPFRLACTATPAPNDHTEIGTHAEFLGIMTRDQMLMRWFLHDSADTGTWRLKMHAVKPFWDWVASWARCISKPSALGFSDEGFVMPELITTHHTVNADRSVATGDEKDGQIRLFRMPNTSATSIHVEKRMTKNARAEMVASIIAKEPDEAWTVWVETDYDADSVMAAIPGAVEIRGSMSADEKERKLSAFSDGEIRVLVTKASIAGFGLNWQHCARTVFAGISFSYESFYQAVRRHWRFRQARDVHCHIVVADTESAIWDIVSRKAGDHEEMKLQMSQSMARAHKSERALHTYQPFEERALPAWI